MRGRTLAQHVPILFRDAAAVSRTRARCRFGSNGIFAVLTIALALSIAARDAQAQCTTVQIAPTATAPGSLSAGDCTIAQLAIDPLDLTFLDIYSVTLVEDGFLTVTLDSVEFDAFLTIYDAGLTEALVSDDDGGAGSNSRIDAIPLPAGTYLILASSFFEGDTGAYTLNTLFDLSGNPACAVQVDLPANASAGGSLSVTDCTIAQLGVDLMDVSFADQYRVTLPIGGLLTVHLQSLAVDAFLWLFDETLTNDIAVDDDGAGGTDAMLQDIPLGPGTYVILANSCCPDQTGAYTLTLVPEPSVLQIVLAGVGGLIVLARSRRRRTGPKFPISKGRIG